MLYNWNYEKKGLYLVGLEGIYLHGFAEKFMGFDMVSTDSLETMHLYQNIKEGKSKGEPIQFYELLQNGPEVITVKVFLWLSAKTKKMRGFVVYWKDEEALNYAIQKMTELASNI
jgi:hypothetical protein